MDQSGAHNGDDAWIEKYREALQKAPVQKGRLELIRRAVEGLRKAIAAYVGKISERSRGVSKAGRKIAVSEPELAATNLKKPADRWIQPRGKKSSRRKAG